MKKLTMWLSVVLVVAVVFSGIAAWQWISSASDVRAAQDENQQLNQTIAGLNGQLSQEIGQANAFEKEVDKIIDG